MARNSLQRVFSLRRIKPRSNSAHPTPAPCGRSGERPAPPTQPLTIGGSTPTLPADAGLPSAVSSWPPPSPAPWVPGSGADLHQWGPLGPLSSRTQAGPRASWPVWQKPTPGPLACGLGPGQRTPGGGGGWGEARGRTTRRPQGARAQTALPHTEESCLLSHLWPQGLSGRTPQGPLLPRQSPALPVPHWLLPGGLGATGSEGVSRGPLVAPNSAKGELSRRLI